MDAKVKDSVSASLRQEAKNKSKSKLEALRGVPTVVHELSHMLHFMNGGKQFIDLSFSGISGTLRDGTSRKEHIKNIVSNYGSGNPREAVAEILTGVAFGRHYDREFLDMYQVFNGPPLL